MTAASIYIQWKGTRPCLDFRCECGQDLHHDGGEFMYFIRCGFCRRLYKVPDTFALIPVEEAQIGKVHESAIHVIGEEEATIARIISDAGL